MGITFEKWITWVFDRPVDPANAWYWDYEGPVLHPKGATALEYLTNLFRNAPTVLKSFSNDQAEQGLHFLIERACCDHLDAYLLDYWFDETIPLEIRKSSIESITDLFSKFYPTRCSEKFSPSREGWQKAEPLHGSCFMWWDLVTSSGLSNDRRVLDQIRNLCLDVMGQVLLIEFRPCWWSALHGLGHWGEYNSEKANAYFDRFFELRQHVAGAEMIAYAKAAQRGEVQ